MAVAIDAAALLTYRAAWRRDAQGLPTTREAAMAKLAATENAQSVVDMALQLFGARGVRVGETLESLCRRSRAAHLRRRQRSPEGHHRPRCLEGRGRMTAGIGLRGTNGPQRQSPCGSPNGNGGCAIVFNRPATIIIAWSSRR